jgi:hypothetical protein
LHKLGIICRHIFLLEIEIGLLHLGDSLKGQLLYKAILVSFKDPFAASRTFRGSFSTCFCIFRCALTSHAMLRPISILDITR